MKILIVSIILLFLSIDVYAGSYRVPVTEVTPIERHYTKRVNVGEECHEVAYREPCHYGSNNGINLGTLIGGVAGVVVGNQFHHHKDAAKVIGGVVGATIGSRHYNRSRYHDVTTYSTVCSPQFELVNTSEIVAYKSCAYVEGRKYCQSANKPLEFLNYRTLIQLQ